MLYKIAFPSETVPKDVKPIEAFVGMQVVDEMNHKRWIVTGLITDRWVRCLYNDGRQDSYISIHGYVPVKECELCEGSGCLADPHHGHAFDCGRCSGLGVARE